MFGRGIYMKARVVKKDGSFLILYKDGTISTPSPRLLGQFMRDFINYSSYSGENGKWTDVSLDMGEFPGETMAYVTDLGQLVVMDPAIIQHAFVEQKSELSDYLTVEEYAEKHNRSPQIIKAFIRNNRIPGITRFGRQLAIPADAPYPVENKSRKPTSGRDSKDN